MIRPRLRIALLALVIAVCGVSLVRAEGFPLKVLWSTVKFINPGSTATGFLVTNAEGNKLFLVTAHHVFERMRGNDCEVLCHRRDEKGEIVKSPQKLMVRKDGKPLWTKHPKADVAAIAAPFSSDASLAVLPWQALADVETLTALDLQPGDLVRTAGYPHGTLFKGNDLEFAVVRLGCLATYPFPPPEQIGTFLLDANTFEGDSGGPVFVWNLPTASGLSRSADQGEKIIGLVVAQHFVDEQFTLIYQSGKFRHRMGLAIAVPSNRIREVIELALQGAQEQPKEEPKEDKSEPDKPEPAPAVQPS